MAVRRKMRVLIEIRHPAKVHLFRNFYHQLIAKGHKVHILAIDKEQCIELLKLYDIPHTVFGTNRRGIFQKAFELLKQEIQLLSEVIRFQPDVLIGGTSPPMAHVSFLLNKPYISVSDTEHAELTWKLTRPFITKILTPQCFLKDFGDKHIRFNGYKELAYLHPNYFEPDPGIYDLLKIPRGEKFIFFRFVAWNALHDKEHYGLSDEIKLKAVKEFSKFGKVLISSEADLPDKLKKYQINIPADRIHHVLYFASLYFGESGTMATESAILGTPTVRVSSIAKLLGNFQELSNKYDLIEFFDSDEKGYHRALELLRDKNSKKEWQRKANYLAENKIDVTHFLVQFILNRSNYE